MPLGSIWVSAMVLYMSYICVDKDNVFKNGPGTICEQQLFKNLK